MTTANFRTDDVIVFSRLSGLNLSRERIAQIVEEMRTLSDGLARLDAMHLQDHDPAVQYRPGGE